MTPVLLRQLRHDVWATEQLITTCRTLTSAQLELRVPGTYGAIRATLAHIVAADESYLTRVLGELLHDPVRWEDIALDDIAAHLGHVKEAIERVFGDGEVDGDRLILDTPARRPGAQRFEMYAWVPLTQFVHHGNDHRAQIAATLSAHGIEPPDLQVWPMAMAIGASREGKS